MCCGIYYIIDKIFIFLRVNLLLAKTPFLCVEENLNSIIFNFSNSPSVKSLLKLFSFLSDFVPKFEIILNWVWWCRGSPMYFLSGFIALVVTLYPKNMHAVFALLCFVLVIHWLIFPYPSGLLHWHCGNLTIVPVPAKQPWWIRINTSSEFIMNDCITTTKQSTTKPCAYSWDILYL